MKVSISFQKFMKQVAISHVLNPQKTFDLPVTTVSRRYMKMIVINRQLKVSGDAVWRCVSNEWRTHLFSSHVVWFKRFYIRSLASERMKLDVTYKGKMWQHGGHSYLWLHWSYSWHWKGHWRHEFGDFNERDTVRPTQLRQPWPRLKDTVNDSVVETIDLQPEANNFALNRCVIWSVTDTQWREIICTDSLVLHKLQS